MIEYVCDGCGSIVPGFKWPTEKLRTVDEILEGILHKPKCCGIEMTQVYRRDNSND